MTAQDLIDIGGWFLLSWSVGFTAGYLMKAIRRVFEISAGGSG